MRAKAMSVLRSITAMFFCLAYCMIFKILVVLSFAFLPREKPTCSGLIKFGRNFLILFARTLAYNLC